MLWMPTTMAICCNICPVRRDWGTKAVSTFKPQLWWDLTTDPRGHKGSSDWAGGARLLRALCGRRTKNTEVETREALRRQRKLFPFRVIREQGGLCCLSSWEILKAQKDKVLSILESTHSWAYIEQKVWLETTRGPLQMSFPMIPVPFFIST